MLPQWVLPPMQARMPPQGSVLNTCPVLRHASARLSVAMQLGQLGQSTWLIVGLSTYQSLAMMQCKLTQLQQQAEMHPRMAPESSRLLSLDSSATGSII